MKFPLWCLGSLILAMTTIAPAQTLSNLANTAQRIGKAPRLPTTQPAMEGEAMPMDRIEKPVLLDDQLEAIRAAIPDFNSVIIRDAGVPGDFPMLPAMTLRNVTLGQFLQFVQASYPGVQCIRIDGPAGSLYSIRIQADENALRRASMAQEQNRLKLYRLNDMISAQAEELMARTPPTTQSENEPKEVTAAKLRADSMKEATNQVLSLLQAALDQTDNDGPSMLKIHEPTLTLMFKGSKAKQTVLDEALSTLQPRGLRPLKFGRSDLPSGFGSGGYGPRSDMSLSPGQPWGSPQDEAYRQVQAAMQENQARLQESQAKLREDQSRIAETMKGAREQATSPGKKNKE